MKKVLLAICLTVLHVTVFAQLNLFTSPPLTGGNGAAVGGITFNVRANSAILLDSIFIALYGTLNASTELEVWYSTTPINGNPQVGTNPNFQQLLPNSPTTVGNSSTAIGAGFVMSRIAMPGGPLLMPAGSIYGFYVGVPTGSTGSPIYQTFSAATGIDTFSNSFITIFTGTNVGYGGPRPGHVNHPRQFVGGLSYIPASGRDARLATLISPVNLSIGANQVIARIQNAAADPITNIDMGYQFDHGTPVLSPGVSLPIALPSGGTYDHTFITPLAVPAAGNYNLKVWVNNANGLGADNNPSNDTLTLNLCTEISGVVTVGGSGATYPGLQAAINDLTRCGISGPVTVLVNPGTYYGSYTINNVPGLSSSNSITFMSASGIASDVILLQDTSSSGSNRTHFTVNAAGGRINFNDLTFHRTVVPNTAQGVLTYGPNASGDVIGCNLQDLTASTSTLNHGIIYRAGQGVILNNTFLGFYYPVWLDGPSTASFVSGNLVSNNEFSEYKYRAIYALNQTDVNISSNQISGFKGTSTIGAGIWTSNTYGANVHSNHIFGEMSTCGILINNPNGDPFDARLNPNRFYNNVINGRVANTLSNSTTLAIQLFNLSGSFSATASPANPRDAVELVNNTAYYELNTTSTLSTQAALNISGGTVTLPVWAYLGLHNNHFEARPISGNLPANFRAVRYGNVSQVDSLESSHNNYRLGGTTPPALFGVTTPANTYTTVPDWQTATARDANSVSIDPSFVSANFLMPSNPAFDDLGLSFAYVLSDILGTPRSLLIPDIGAYEFSPRATDASMMSAVGTTFGCSDDSATVVIKIGNYGTVPITTLLVGYISSSGAFSTDTLSNLNLAFGDTLRYTFPLRARLLTGLNTITAFVELPGDLLLANDSISFTVNKVPLITSFPYFENWENGTGGWVATGTNSSWALGTPNNTVINSAFSGNNAWVTNLTGPYNNSEFSFLQSPCFDLTGLLQTFVEFKLWWVTETTWDGLNLQYSTDGGTTWDVLGSVGSGILNWYNRISVSSSQGQPVWSGTAAEASPGYVTVRHSLSSLPANSTVIFRLRFTSDASINFDGIAVDDFVVGFPPPADMSVVSIVSPVTACDGQLSDTVRIRVLNAGTVAQSNFPLNYQINGGIPVTETFAATINPGDTVIYTFTTLIAGGLSLGTNVVTAYPSLAGDVVFNNDTARRTVNVIPSISTYPYVENFDSSVVLGWTSGGSNSSWALGIPASASISAAASAPNAWMTNRTGNYNPNEASWVQGPCFDFTSLTDAVLEVDVWRDIENNWDGAQVQYSIDGGLNWQVLGNQTSGIANWYNNQNTFGPLVGQPVWSNRLASQGWVRAQHSLSVLNGQASVLFRMFFGSDGSVQYEGFGFDNFTVRVPMDPEITSVSVLSDSCVAAARTVTASVLHFVPLTQVNLHYDTSGTGVFLNAPMLLNPVDSMWSGIIPASRGGVQVRYYVSVLDSAGLTDTSANFRFVDEYLRPFAGNDTTIVAGATATLRGQGAAFQAVVGTGTVVNTTTSYPAPYGNYWWGARHQFLIMASELSAQGIGAGPLSALEFDVVTPSGTSLNDFSIRLGHTTQTAMTNWLTATTQVFNAASYLDVAGWNLHAFQTPFVWDGSSNLVVEVCFNNASFTTNSVVNQTTTPFVSSMWYNADASGVCTNTTSNGTSSNRPNMKLRGGYPFTWRDLSTGTILSSTLQVLPVSPLFTTQYEFTLNDGVCSKSDTLTVFVTQNNTTDIGVSQILLPVAPVLNGPNLVKVVIRNYGNQPATGFDVGYRVVGGAELSTNAISRTIQPGDTIHHIFTLSWTPIIGGIINFCAYTKGLAGDNNLANDTTCVVYQAVGVREVSNLLSRVYPNPADQYVKFELVGSQGVGTLEIRDQLGRVVWREQVDLSTGNTHEVKTEAYAAGVYNYRFILRDQVQHGQVVIRR